jgi:hypothetical protein
MAAEPTGAEYSSTHLGELGVLVRTIVVTFVDTK